MNVNEIGMSAEEFRAAMQKAHQRLRQQSEFTAIDGTRIVPSRSCGRFLTFSQIARIEGVPIEQVIERYAGDALVPVTSYQRATTQLKADG